MVRTKFSRLRPITEPLPDMERFLLATGGPGGRSRQVIVAIFGGERSTRRAWEQHRDEVEIEWERMGRTGECWAAREFGG